MVQCIRLTRSEIFRDCAYFTGHGDNASDFVRPPVRVDERMNK